MAETLKKRKIKIFRYGITENYCDFEYKINAFLEKVHVLDIFAWYNHYIVIVYEELE
jgi:hypothetical protein